MRSIILSLAIFTSYLFSSFDVVELQSADYDNENIRVNSSNITSTSLIFEIDNFNVQHIDGQNGKIIRLTNGAQIMKQGAPDLPKNTSSIIIPDSEKMQAFITRTEFTEYRDYDILPSKGNLSRLVDPSEIDFEYGVEYSRDSFYPENIVELGNPYILRDVRGISVITHPIQYNPVSKILRVYNLIEVEVRSVGRDFENIITRKNNLNKRSFEFENIYDSHFINTQNDTRFDYIVEHGNMLIICNEAFLSTMEPFVQWKRYKGIPVEMVGVTEAGGSATAIKNFITDYYYTNGLTFVLLVGDEGQLPSVYVNGSASDPSFSFILGNDSYSDIIVGRFSGQSPGQIETQVERSINYERYPTNGDWYQKALGIASQEGPGMNGYTDDDFNDWLWSSVLSQYSYDQYDGIYDSNGGNVTQGVNAVNAGAGIVNYTGHGSITSWGNGAPLSTSNVNSLTNNGQLPFVITVGCNVGEFQSTNECFSEAWQRSTHNGQPAGAIANMGSTIPQSWVPPMHGQWAMNKILTESFDGVGGDGAILTRTLGGIAINGCLHMNDAQGAAGTNESTFWTFFGDPTVNIRTLPPSQLFTNYESTVLIGQEDFNISTGNQGDLVAISRNGELISSGYTNSNGSAVLDITGLSSQPGTADIVISSYNKYIYEGELTVIAPEGAYLTYHSYEVVSEENSNGSVDYNENVTLKVYFENIGIQTFEGSTGTFGSIDLDYITSETVYLTIDPIYPGELGFTYISFSTSSDVPDGYMAQFWYDLGFGFEGQFEISISAPNFQLSDPIVFDENGNGVWEAGEYANIQVTYSNIGGSDFYNYPGITIESLSDYVIIQNNQETFYGIGSGEFATHEFYAEALENTPLGTVAEFVITFGPSEVNNCLENLTSCPEISVLPFNTSIGLQFNETLNEPQNLLAYANDYSINVSWEPPSSCPIGQFSDCMGNCQENFYLDSWLGDGVCDDGSWGVYFNCDEFNCDEGDCECGTEGDDGGVVPNPYCGDGNCDQLEDSLNCPEDCTEEVIGSCENNCGGNAGSCWCDDQCMSLGDCCPDFNEFCSDSSLVNNGKIYEFYHTPDGFRSMQLYNISIGNYNTREFIGYNLYRDGLFLNFTSDTNYTDTDVIGGVEYCYDVLSIYDEGISNLSNSDCASVENQLLMGDLNGDGSINVTDIIVEINIITTLIEPTDYHWIVGDLNTDGSINVLDIVSIVNLILGISLSQSNYDEAELEITSSSFSLINSNGLAGFQFKYDGELENDIILKDWNITINNGFIVGYTFKRNINEIKFDKSGINIVGEVLYSDVNGFGGTVRSNLNPNKYGLITIYPNPFNPTTTISYDLIKVSNVNITIVDLLGNQLMTLTNEIQNIGRHNIKFDGSLIPSGIYFVKLDIDDKSYINKLILMK